VVVVKKLDITKEKYFRLVLERMLQSAPNGVYASEIMSELKLGFKEISAVSHYLESCNAVTLSYPGKDFPIINGTKPVYMMIMPRYEKLLSVYTQFFTFRGWIKRAQDYGFIISIVSIIIAIISLVLAAYKR